MKIHRLGGPVRLNLSRFRSGAGRGTSYMGADSARIVMRLCGGLKDSGVVSDVQSIKTRLPSLSQVTYLAEEPRVLRRSEA